MMAGLFCIKELYSRCYLKYFSEFLKHKAETSLRSSSWKLSNIFKTLMRNLVNSSCLVALEHIGCKPATVNREFLENC